MLLFDILLVSISNAKKKKPYFTKKYIFQIHKKKMQIQKKKKNEKKSARSV